MARTLSIKIFLRRIFIILAATAAFAVFGTGLLLIDFEKAAAPNCRYRGSESSSRRPIVTFDCSNETQSVEEWQENMRIIKKFVVYDAISASLIFTDRMRNFYELGSEPAREEFFDEVLLYSNLLALGAQTAVRAPKFKKGLGIRPLLWAMQFRLARYLIDGPLFWTFPSDINEVSTWGTFYSFPILMPAAAFHEMCSIFEPYRGACDDTPYIPLEYLKIFVFYEPMKGPCSLEEEETYLKSRLQGS